MKLTLFLISFQMTISLRLEDKMNRQLSCVVDDGEGAGALTDELVRYGFISQVCVVIIGLLGI